jgi:hypothetical protein
MGMSQSAKKQALLLMQPKCPSCGCHMVIHQPRKGVQMVSHAAVELNGALICYACHNRAMKEVRLNALPLFPRMKRKIDRVIPIFSLFRRMRKMTNQFYYFKIKGGKPTSKLPKWLRKSS